MLFYASLIEGVDIPACIGEMVAVVDGEVMGAREVFLGTHVDVVVVLVVEDGIDACDGGDADGTWRQSGYSVGIVGRGGLQVYVEHTADGEVAYGIDDGGVALQEDASMEAVHIESGYACLFAVVGGLAVDDAGEGDDFVLRQSDLFGEGGAVGIPEGGVLLRKTFDELIDGGLPIDLVCVGDEEGREGLLGVT